MEYCFFFSRSEGLGELYSEMSFLAKLEARLWVRSVLDFGFCFFLKSSVRAMAATSFYLSLLSFILLLFLINSYYSPSPLKIALLQAHILSLLLGIGEQENSWKLWKNDE